MSARLPHIEAQKTFARARVLPRSGAMVLGGELLHKPLFEVGGRPISPFTFVVVAMILLFAALASRALGFVMHRALVRRGVAEGREMRSLERLLNYVIMLVAVLVALETAGIDLSAVLAASAVFAVGIGLGIQGIAMNFVSGVVLLVERSIKLDDVIELDGKICRVVHLGIRATRVRTLFEEDIIVPNGTLVQTPIKNLTLADSLIRVPVRVGVPYGTDVAKVRATLERVAQGLSGIDATFAPVVLLDAFGVGALEFEVSVWVHDPWHHRRHQSRLREAIHDAFRAEKIPIASPQIDVHVIERRAA